MGASIDNIRICDCVCKCDPVIVEYKCLMKHKDTDPKEAFLSPEIAGCVVGKKLQLESRIFLSSADANVCSWSKGM